MCSVCTFIVFKQSWLSQFPNSGCHQGIATFEPIPECKAQRNIGTSMPHLVSKWSFKSSSLQVLAFHPRLRAGNTRSGRPSTSSMVSSSETSAIQVISRVQTFWRRVDVQLRKPWPGQTQEGLESHKEITHQPLKTRCKQFGVEEHQAARSLLVHEGMERLHEPQRWISQTWTLHLSEFT